MSSVHLEDDFLMIGVNEVIIGDRSRELDQAWVEALADGFKVVEMESPITLFNGDDGAVLIAGHHRLAAHKLMGAERILAKWSKAKTLAEAKLIEVAENVMRRELNAFDRAHHLHDLFAALEEINPKLKKGGDKQTEKGRADLSEIFALRSNIADQVGLSRRAIQMAIALWNGLSDVSKERVKGTWLAGHQSNLKTLSEQKKPVQVKILDMLFPASGQPKATNVPDALFIIENGRVLTSVERKFAGINKTLLGLADDELDQVLTTHEERIMAWVERRLGGDK